MSNAISLYTPIPLMNMALMCTIVILSYIATTSTTVIDEFLYLVSYLLIESER